MTRWQEEAQDKTSKRLSDAEFADLPSYESLPARKKRSYDRFEEMKALSPYERKRLRMKWAPEKENIFATSHRAPRRDDFWRWGTTSISEVSILRALLERMLARRYHKWNSDTTYTHEWGEPADSDDGETTELFILIRMRNMKQVPSVLKFRMKKAVQGGDDDIRIVIDYHRLHTNHAHQFAAWIARDGVTRLIVEMDDWYRLMKERKIGLLGEESVDLEFEKIRLLEDKLANVKPAPQSGVQEESLQGVGEEVKKEIKKKSRFFKRSGVRSTALAVPLERGNLKEKVLFDSKKWDLKPLRSTAWPIPRVDGTLSHSRARLSTEHTHR